MSKYKCPVCLTYNLSEEYSHYNHDICLMCGIEFGYEDCVPHTSDKEVFDKSIAESHKFLRKIWQDAGSKNWEEETKKPEFKGGVEWFNTYFEEHPEEHDQRIKNFWSGLKRVECK